MSRIRGRPPSKAFKLSGSLNLSLHPLLQVQKLRLMAASAPLLRSARTATAGAGMATACTTVPSWTLTESGG